MQHNCPGKDKAAFLAALVGQLPSLKLAHQLGCSLNKLTARAAAEGCHLCCLQYIHQSGCPWDSAVTRVAASNGSLECLQYAHEQGCPWWEASNYKANIFDTRCFLYAQLHGAPTDSHAQARHQVLQDKRQALVCSFAFARRHNSESLLPDRASCMLWCRMSCVEPELVKYIAQLAEWCL